MGEMPYNELLFEKLYLLNLVILVFMSLWEITVSTIWEASWARISFEVSLLPRPGRNTEFFFLTCFAFSPT